MRAFTIQIEVKAQTEEELQDVCNRLFAEMKQMYGNASSFGNITFYEIPQPIPVSWGWTQNRLPGYVEDAGQRIPQRQPRKLCVRTDDAERTEMVKAAIKDLDHDAKFDAESNPVTFWVNTVLEMKTIRCMLGVYDIILSRSVQLDTDEFKRTSDTRDVF